MKNVLFVSLAIVTMLSVGVLLGCGESEPAPPAGDANSDGQAANSAQAEIEAALATLSETDQQAARAQKICPVSDEPLGSMGAPIKITVDGRDVFICCAGCEDLVKADPSKYLAKLPPQG